MEGCAVNCFYCMKSQKNKMPLRPPWRVLKLKLSSKGISEVEKRLEILSSLSAFVEDSAKIEKTHVMSVGFLIFG